MFKRRVSFLLTLSLLALTVSSAPHEKEQDIDIKAQAYNNYDDTELKDFLNDDETYVDKEKDTSNLKEELDPDNDINPDDITADEIPKKKDTITPSQNEIHMNDNSTQDRERRDTSGHYTEELLAQAMCQSLSLTGWGRVYAVGRNCPPWPSHGDSCNDICTSSSLRSMDFQTQSDRWSCLGAFHVYYGRPATAKNGNSNTATLGLKSMHQTCGYTRCGPNFCCCIAER